MGAILLEAKDKKKVEEKEEEIEKKEEVVEEKEDEEEKPVVIEFVDPIEQIKRRREAIKAKRARMTKSDPKRELIEMEAISKKQIRQDLEKVKFSVQQFGLQAYNPEQRRKIERERLIRL